MPWHLERRDEKWCVIKDSDGSTAGCHSSRADAIKQQRALYANESRMASMYAELDEMVEEQMDEPARQSIEQYGRPSELVKIEIGKEQDALIASLSERMEEMSQRQAETQLALVAALQAIGTRDPVVNVEQPKVDVRVEPPSVTVEPPAVTVEAPEVTVQAAAAPNVTVHPEIVLPSTKRRVEFTRDILTDRLTSAEIVEE